MAKTTITSKAFRFTPDELSLLEAAAEKHGNYKAAVMAGLRLLESGDNEAVSEAVATELERMAMDIRERLK